MSLWCTLFGHRYCGPNNYACGRCGKTNPRLVKAREEWENRDTEPLSKEEWEEMFHE